MNRPFIKGLDLGHLLYEEAVAPTLARHLPHLAHSAALLGPGSEVLGFDDPQSSDHDWGPRLMLFLDEVDLPAHRDEIDALMRQELPREVHGYPIDLAVARASAAQTGEARQQSPGHWIRVLAVRPFFEQVLRFDPTEHICAVDWVSVPEQLLRSLTGGRVFHDGLGQLAPIRSRLRYYPHDVWLYLLVAQWSRIGQEEAFMGRCGQVDDDLGSRLVAARLVRDLMRLCFLMEQQYAPYIKWLGTAFARLDCAAELGPVLSRALTADSWQARERPLTRAYECVARMHNDLHITDPLPARVSPYYERPFLVIHASRFADAIHAQITSAEVLALPASLGSVDQFADSTDALNVLERLKRVY